jgi:signal peptidase I
LTKTRKSVVGSAAELLLIVVVAVGLALAVQAFLVKPYRIPSASMEPTLHINQRILVDRLATTLGSSPKIGEIIVFHPPADYGECADPNQGDDVSGQSDAQACDVAQRKPAKVTFVKRVVGLPGDRLSIRNGLVYRNGKREASSFTIPCDGDASCNFPRSIVVPKGDYYMMGDNRPDSDDSRFWGPVPRAWLIGKVFFSYWPPDRIGTL